MANALSRIKNRLVFVTTLSFMLMPPVAFMIAAFLDMVDIVDLLTSTTGLYIVASYVCLTAWVAWHFKRYCLAFEAWHAHYADSQNPSEKLNDHLTSFTTNYWSFYLIAILALPTLQHWGGFVPTNVSSSSSLLQTMLLHLVIAIFVAMPGYILSLTVLGKYSHYIGLRNVNISLKTKMWLIGAYLPILVTTVLLKYYWWRTGFLETEILLAWAMIALAVSVVTVLAIRSLHHSLLPVERVINSGGAIPYKQLAQQLKPRSNDEIGYLTQMLGRMFDKLVDQESHVSAIVNHAAEGIIVLDENLLIDTFNPAAEKQFGYSRQEIQSKPLQWLIPELDVKNINPEDKLSEQEVFGRHCNGTSVPLWVRVSEMQRDQSVYYTLIVTDISDHKAAERLLLEAELRYRTLVETAHDLVWSMNIHGQWTYLNNAVTEIYGYTPDEMLNRHYSEFQSPDYKDSDDAAVEKVMQGQELVGYETIHLDRNLQHRYISFNARPVFNEQGEVIQVTGTARDITEQKKFEKELTYQAQHDKLTKLFNRSYFQSELERVISRVTRSAAECALLYLDLDQFKYVNDTLGHAAGDRLLIECTDILRKNIREGDLLARFGGDEFTILLYNITREDSLRVAENIRTMFEHYRFMDSGKTFNVTCSLGLTTIDSSTESAEEALSQADLACNISKSSGRNCVHQFSEEDNKRSEMATDMGWVSRVRDAIDNDRFKLLYQPIVSLSSDDIHGYEVLLRLPTDDGDIMPGGFIPAAERFGLVNNIDRWTVRRSMEYLSELHSDQMQTQFAINLSGRAFEDQNLLSLIKGILGDTGLNPGAITFEITETAAIANLQAARRFIGNLKDLGCRIALDDFGSGFCSFTYLKHLPVDSLKIDGSFVQALEKTKVDQAMVQSMNQIAHALGKTTIAEFVETQATLDLLKEYGIDYAQGHYLGRPRQNLLHSLSQDASVEAPLSA